jgi:HlyD family secretion protein
VKLLNLLLLGLAVIASGCAKEAETRTWNLAKVENRDIVVAVQAAGVIEPVTTVEMKSKASGEILAISADIGDLVPAGQVLVQIDKRTPRNGLALAEAELEAARARRDIAESQSERAELLFKSGTLNQVELEQSMLEFANAKAEVVRAQVGVENARISLDDTEVRAPINGTVIQRDVEVGQVISSPVMDMSGGTVLLRMADLQFVQVRALVDETDIGKIAAGQKAIVTVAAYPNQPFEGTILKIEPQSNDDPDVVESVTLFAVIVTIDNKSGLLKPGMNAEVTVDIASRLDVPAIPTIALRIGKDVKAAALFTGIDESVIREQLRAGGMAVADVVSAASSYDDEAAEKPAANPAAADAKPPATEQSQQAQSGQGFSFGGQYWVFVLTNGQPVARYIETGLTDLDYSEVVKGLAAGEEIVLLPSSDLILSQDRFRAMIGQAIGMPGMKSDKK